MAVRFLRPRPKSKGLRRLQTALKTRRHRRHPVDETGQQQPAPGLAVAFPDGGKMAKGSKAQTAKTKKAGEAPSVGEKRGRKKVAKAGVPSEAGAADVVGARPKEGGTRGTVKKTATKNGLRSRAAEVLDEVIQRFEALLKNDKVKPTVGDYIRLLQLRRELGEGEEGTKEIKITWVDQMEESCSGK
jgi:hypothetical protein